MKKIGYIYKYSVEEKKGILVYGQWCSQSHIEFSFQHIILKDKPVKFTSSDCIGEVKTGDLVYFNFENGAVSEIERASLLNFDKSLLTEYSQNRFIIFEQIMDKDSCRIKDGILTVLEKYISSTIYIGTEGDHPHEVEYLDLVKNKYIRKSEIPFDDSFPSNVDDLYECFGKYGHEKRYDSILKKKKIRNRRDRDNSLSIDIFDLSRWIDEDMILQHHYGMNIKEILNLYHIFVKKESIEKVETKHYSACETDDISSAWTLLLAGFSNEDLRNILKKAPSLQPVLPIRFCKENIDALNDKYGMPNIDICKEYAFYKVNNASTATDYKYWSRKLDLFANCKAIHSSGEGVPMCSMGKEHITGLVDLLENNYLDKIKTNIKNSIDGFLRLDSHELLCDFTKTELLSIGAFLDELFLFKTLSSKYNAGMFSYRFEKIVEAYNSLGKKERDLLVEAWTGFVSESLLKLSVKEDVSPFCLGYKIDLVKDYINNDVRQKILANVNDRFSMISDLSDLKDAFEYDFISEDQFLNIIKRVTANFSTRQLASLITEFSSDNGNIHFPNIPIDSQNYILNRIVEVYDTRELHKGEAVGLSDYNGFCNLENFIRWLTELKSGQYGQIDYEAIESAISKAINPLSNVEIQYLYNKKYLVKPGQSITTILAKKCQQLENDVAYQNYRDSLFDDYSDSRYSGSWAHDVEGYSDDDIDTIFDGDPDAYWNID